MHKNTFFFLENQLGTHYGAKRRRIFLLSFSVRSTKKICLVLTDGVVESPARTPQVEPPPKLSPPFCTPQVPGPTTRGGCRQYFQLIKNWTEFENSPPRPRNSRFSVIFVPYKPPPDFQTPNTRPSAHGSKKKKNNEKSKIKNQKCSKTENGF